MNIKRFRKLVRHEYCHDIYAARYPRRRFFKQMKESLNGMTSENVMQLLSAAARAMPRNEIYLEVGCFQGCTSCAAMSEVRRKRFIFVDNFSEFDNGGNKKKLLRNLKRHHRDNHYTFIQDDFRMVLAQHQFPPVGVYMYDGAHDYKSQKDALVLAYPFLAEDALVIVDDANMPDVRKADDEMVATGKYKLMWRLRSRKNGTLNGWWNGLDVLVKV